MNKEPVFNGQIHWTSRSLYFAALYNVVWGAFVVLRPNSVFDWAHLEIPNYPELWQCIGMIVGVYGVGYCLAASDPIRHWPIVLVGLLGKIFGPIGFVWALCHNRFNLPFGAVIIFNDLIWWVPFAYSLRMAWKNYDGV